MKQEDIDEATKFLSHLRVSLPSEVCASNISGRAKIPLKAYSFHVALKYRALELGEGSLEALLGGKVVTASLLSRALIEVVAMYYWLFSEIRKCRDFETIQVFDAFVIRGSMGTRWSDENTLHAFNALTAIEKLSKEYETFSSFYADLSEFSHPNFSGVLGFYASLDKENRRWDFSIQQTDAEVYAVGGLMTSLLILDAYSRRFENSFSSFVKLCEANLASERT